MRRLVWLLLFVPMFAVNACITAMPTHWLGHTDRQHPGEANREGKDDHAGGAALFRDAQSVSKTADTETWSYMYWHGKPATFGNSYSKSETQSLTVKFQGGKGGRLHVFGVGELIGAPEPPAVKTEERSGAVFRGSRSVTERDSRRGSGSWRYGQAGALPRCRDG